MLEAELALPFDDVFAEFEPKATAAASLAQARTMHGSYHNYLPDAGLAKMLLERWSDNLAALACSFDADGKCYQEFEW